MIIKRERKKAEESVEVRKKKSRDSKLQTFLTQTPPFGMNTMLSASFFLFGVPTFPHAESVSFIVNEHKKQHS